MKILVSACLLGTPCRYDGASRPCPRIQVLAAHHELIPVCGERAGGLDTPRPPAERVGDRVYTRTGVDVTASYHRGAAAVLQIALENGCTTAILKARSPSCGSGQIYDGTFSGTLTAGWGVTAQLLRDCGILVLDENAPLDF